jgi:hypothetical protein
MLDELIERYSRFGVITAYPLMLDTGPNYRWKLEIDGAPAPSNLIVLERGIPGSPHGRVLVLTTVSGDEEVELIRWSTKTPDMRPPYGLGAVTTTLGALHRAQPG